ncbi:rhodanese-like domain-containing protein [Aetokthonos hydrillicola Thurmond2011]|jgi:rhodanese-related sulfurtransferase|uniref:Rhodanese-like domain-containing protein n=1 Tax=Aetokthonos hydrillicola Thurmond2011 TaxID=2712845 RepID=A0AAP5I6Z9_9CYAN|nr:rhodanese-like domain-containing protein [Aetokthonos hydrillicola]MBO3461889.1 rhodanese-like domain-containing protein [Aetokthonos hydrillicola CCALA 1050]MBW4586769.1 rhodanese-like domain-containing protein [Aetokthonos hydrillicola CCALA 1050]MDR9895874.1 rhodanese-like domain-containing protein [Aetokthonos hydrillicola Thurmond2011]
MVRLIGLALIRSVALSFVTLVIKVKFPRVRQITTKEFAQWLEQKTKPQPLLLDARTQVEYNVSHLKAAQRIDPTEPNLSQCLTVAKETPIVVYCSVGYRSARVAEQIQIQGFSRVFNLSGGIFQWANEKRPVFKDDHSAKLIHPYNATWAKLLRSDAVMGQ